MSNNDTKMVFGNSNFGPAHGWGRATQSPQWRDIGHGVLESIGQPGEPKNYIQRNQDNKWQSVKKDDIHIILAAKEEEAQQAVQLLETLLG